jgi:hypothetical protein
MKKRTEKPKAKPAASKSKTAQKTLPRKAADAALVSSDDSLRSMLKGVHTHRVCR